MKKNAEKRAKKLVGVKRRRKNIPLSFFPNRLVKVDGYDHEKQHTATRGICVMCAIETKKEREESAHYSSDDGSKAYLKKKRATATHLVCATCSTEETPCYLCTKHWDKFHTDP